MNAKIMTFEQQQFIKELNPMNIEARYPDYKEQIAVELSDVICIEIIAGTEALLCWIKEQL
ncbi:MAG: HEPN domain-containing protein [Firmicutes bacterium]|nr:HEPN domain-containing protein [Bacillota bacterium]